MRARLLIVLLGAGVTIVLIVVAVLVSSGQSSRDEALDTVPPPATTATSRTTPRIGNPADGRDVFLGQGCGNCHRLGAAGSTGTIGPELDGRAPDYERFLEQVTDGGGGMPAFEGILTLQQIHDVVAFVNEALASSRQ